MDNATPQHDPTPRKVYRLVNVPRRGRCIVQEHYFTRPGGSHSVAFYYRDAPDTVPADAPQHILEAAYQAMKGIEASNG